MKIRGLLVIILFAIVIVSYFSEALFFNGILSFRDLSRYFYPLRLYTVNTIKSGIIPLWNPYISCGVPHLALQQSVIFYPLSAIYYIFPFDRAFNIFLIIHIFLAGFFVYMLCRQWGLRESSSILSAVTFMFSGYIISVMNLATTLSSCVWLPLILLFYDKALVSGSAGSLCLSAMSLSVMFLGGEPSIFYSTVWILLFYSIFFWLNNRKAGAFKKTFTFFFATAAIGLLLSGIQLLPFLEFSRLTDRAPGQIPYELLTNWSLHLKDTVSFIIPFLGRTDFSNEGYWQEQNWVMLIYIGALSIILIPLCLALRKDWRIKFLFFLGLLFLLISYGNSTPFYYILYKFIPGFNVVRYPVRFLYATTFAASVLCGAGLDAYFTARRTRDDRLVKFFRYLLPVLYLLAIMFLILHLYKNGLFNMFYRFFTSRMAPKEGVPILLSSLAGMVNVKRFLGFVIAAGILLFLGLKLKMRQGLISFSLVSIVAADLLSALPQAQIMLDYGTLHKATPNIEYLRKNNSLFRFYASPKMREADQFLKGKTYEEAIQSVKDKFCANWPVMFGLYDLFGYDSIHLADYVKMLTLLDTSPHSSITRLLDMLNVKYIAVQDKIDVKGYKLVNEGSAYLYENTNVLPRAYLVDSFKVLKNETDIANRFKSREFDPAREVSLEEEPNPAFSFQLSAFRLKEKVEITKYSPNEVIIKTTVNSPKFLVLSDTYYPGWKVYVDGRPDKIYKANFVLRAVHIGPGEHALRFVFDPLTFKLGLGISLVTLLFIIVWPVLFETKRRYEISFNSK